MAWPTTPEFCLKSANTIASGDWLAFPQPNDFPPYEPLLAPRRGTGDGGHSIDGLDGVRLRWSLLSQADFAEVMAHYRAALAGNGTYYARVWDEEASSGAGAYASFKCVPQRPVGRPAGIDSYADVTMDLLYLGIA